MIDTQAIIHLLNQIKKTKAQRFGRFVELRKHFLEAQRTPEDLKAFLELQQEEGDSVLHFVIKYADQFFAAALLQAGADVFRVGEKSETAFLGLLKKEWYIMAEGVTGGSAEQWQAVLAQIATMPAPQHPRDVQALQRIKQMAAKQVVSASEAVEDLLHMLQQDPVFQEVCFERLEAIFLQRKQQHSQVLLNQFWKAKALNGDPVLHLAIQYGALKLVDTLLKGGTYVFQRGKNNETAFYLLVKHHHYDLATEYVMYGKYGGVLIRNGQQETVMYQLCALPLPESTEKMQALTQLMQTLFTKVIPEIVDAPEIEMVGPTSLMQTNPHWHPLLRSIGVVELKVPYTPASSEQTEVIAGQFLKAYALADAIELSNALREMKGSYEMWMKLFLGRSQQLGLDKPNKISSPRSVVKKVPHVLKGMFLKMLSTLKTSLQAILHTPEEYRQAEKWLKKLDLEAWILTKYSLLCQTTEPLPVGAVFNHHHSTWSAARLESPAVVPPRIQFGSMSPSSPAVSPLVQFPAQLKGKKLT